MADATSSAPGVGEVVRRIGRILDGAAIRGGETVLGVNGERFTYGDLRFLLDALSRPAPGRQTREEVPNAGPPIQMLYELRNPDRPRVGWEDNAALMAAAADEIEMLFSAPQDQPEDQGAFRADALHPTEREDGPGVGWQITPDCPECGAKVLTLHAEDCSVMIRNREAAQVGMSDSECTQSPPASPELEER